MVRSQIPAFVLALNVMLMMGTGDATPSGASHSQPVLGRPQIFMSVHGSNYLADNPALASQWEFVAQNLNGLWGNYANITVAQQTQLWNEVKTRNVITEEDISSAPLLPVEKLVGAQTGSSNFVLNRQAVAVYTNKPDVWNTKTVAQARVRYVTNAKAPAWQLSKAIYTGWGIQNWVAPTSTSAKGFPTAYMGAFSQAGSQAAFDASSGSFVELYALLCPASCVLKAKWPVQALVTAIKAAHAQGKAFVWFASNGATRRHPSYLKSGWLAEIQDTYNYVAAQHLWWTSDVIVVINYFGTYAILPETVNGNPADSVTGILDWLLQLS